MTTPPPKETKPAAPALAARDSERFFARGSDGRLRARARFSAIVAAVLLVHAAAILYVLYHDSHAAMRTAQIEETPVEVVVEQPKEPPPPPRPKPQEEKPKPKEEMEKPALSAPRAPNQETVKTERTQDKTQAPKTTPTPQDGQPEKSQQAAAPREEAKPETKDDAAPKPEENRPDAEALDKAKPKVDTVPKTKAAKPAPKTKPTMKTAMAMLSGTSALPDFSFAKPTPKSPVYGGTEDVRYLAIVQGMLTAKVAQLPKTANWQAGGHVLLYFHIDESGRVISYDFYEKSGYPDVDRLALNALMHAGPFPPPPSSVQHGLLWGATFDGQLPRLTVNRQR